MSRFYNVLLGFLIALTSASGLVKLFGVRMDFMRITHVEFADWQITFFGAIQVITGLLVFYPASRKIGLFVYSSIYLFASYFYFTYDLSPKAVPLLLSVLPIVAIILRNKVKKD